MDRSLLRFLCDRLRGSRARRVLLGATALAAGACAAPPPADAPFPVGTTFAWLGTDAGGARRNAPADASRYTIAFDASGRVVLALDCNRGSAQWKRDGTRLAMTPIAATKMMCPRGSLDVAFASDLAQVESWRYDGSVLVLSGRDGSTMRFRPQ
ncbi:MAG TPA: META domain-containing protein [Casimicrobiaceae bacterium]|nr:META domain-containing protein [Casimicrobiaceae bacterium]